MSGSDYALLALLAVVFVGIVAIKVRRSSRMGAELQAMIDDAAIKANADIRDQSGEVALLWVEDDAAFVYLNAITGTLRRIGADEVRSVELLENGMTIRHVEDPAAVENLEEPSSGIHGMLPAEMQNKVERLEVTLVTKSGGPPLGYSIPVVEQGVSPYAEDYVALRDNLMSLTSKWRSLYELT